MRDPRPASEVVNAEGIARAINLKHVAGLLYTYRCTLACKHCCFNCSPRRPSTRPDTATAVEYLRQLHATDRVVHIAGGEALLFYPDVIEICCRAQEIGAAPHFIETNASFAVTDEITRARLLALHGCGVQGLLISSDPYHHHDCPGDRFARCRRIAVETFGEHNVIAAERSDADLRDLEDMSRDPVRLAEYTRRHPPMLSGRAGDELAVHFTDRPLDDLTDAMWHGGEGTTDCSLEFDPERMWEIHIDPHGNAQTCCCIIVGNVNETPLPEMMRQGFLGRSPIVDAVYHHGPRGLLKLARSHGYAPREGYPQKCGMCWEVRRFLRPFYPDAIGPDEAYDLDPSGY